LYDAAQLTAYPLSGPTHWCQDLALMFAAVTHGCQAGTSMVTGQAQVCTCNQKRKRIMTACLRTGF